MTHERYHRRTQNKKKIKKERTIEKAKKSDRTKASSVKRSRLVTQE